MPLVSGLLMVVWQMYRGRNLTRLYTWGRSGLSQARSLNHPAMVVEALPPLLDIQTFEFPQTLRTLRYLPHVYCARQIACFVDLPENLQNPRMMAYSSLWDAMTSHWCPASHSALA